MISKQVSAKPASAGWRFQVGLVLFILGLACPLAVPLVALTSLPVVWKVTLGGLLVLGLPELFWLAAAAVMGKPGFKYLKEKTFGFFRRLVLKARMK